MSTTRPRQLSDFANCQEIASGAYSTVIRAYDKVSGSYFALKKQRILSQTGFSPTFLREVSLLQTLQSPFVVELKDVIPALPDFVYLAMEYLETDLSTFLRKSHGKISEEIAKTIVHQILQGVEYCHRHRIVHRDLKPENILLDERRRLKIADFGLARVFAIPIQPMTNPVQTLPYRAPEVLFGVTNYTPAVDVWSVGCIFAEVILGRKLFDGCNELHQILSIIRVLGLPARDCYSTSDSFRDMLERLPTITAVSLRDVMKGASEECIDLLEKMVSLDPKSRISASDALTHPYFRGVSDQFLSQA